MNKATLNSFKQVALRVHIGRRLNVFLRAVCSHVCLRERIWLISIELICTRRITIRTLLTSLPVLESHWLLYLWTDFLFHLFDSTALANERPTFAVRLDSIVKVLDVHLQKLALGRFAFHRLRVVYHLDCVFFSNQLAFSDYAALMLKLLLGLFYPLRANFLSLRLRLIWINPTGHQIFGMIKLVVFVFFCHDLLALFEFAL